MKVKQREAKGRFTGATEKDIDLVGLGVVARPVIFLL